MHGILGVKDFAVVHQSYDTLLGHFRTVSKEIDQVAEVNQGEALFASVTLKWQC